MTQTEDKIPAGHVTYLMLRTKLLLIFLFWLGLHSKLHAQKVGPPNNIGREYGNPRMPLMVSHLAGPNKERLKRANKNARHSIFGKILCFRRLCRIQAGHSVSLRAISYKKFQKKIEKNAKKGEYKGIRSDTTKKAKPPVQKIKPTINDTIKTPPSVRAQKIKADTLIILGAELLFETNKSTLRKEDFEKLNPIVDYLQSNPNRLAKISGHTDNTGSESHNLKLSKLRADVVAEYLIKNGIDINRIETIGLGSTQPIAPNSTLDGRMKNRRVELLLFDEK